MAERKNVIAGTWRMVEAYVDAPEGRVDLYGGHADGVLVFTEGLHFIEMLRDRAVEPIALGEREKGTPAENAAIVAGTLAQYGTYSVGPDGTFTGNTIEASTFPNWNGLTRDTGRLRLTVREDTLIEELTDPGAPRIMIQYRREG